MVSICAKKDMSKRHTIMMVTDFFYPDFGGVEIHIYYLSQSLIFRGHRVIVVTHTRANLYGVRYMARGLKVFYLPNRDIFKVVAPLIYSSTSLIRDIIIREKVTIVHGHSSFSPIAYEAIMHASLMGLPTVFTDHSLFGFKTLRCIILNTLFRYCMMLTNYVICVSHTGRANTVLKASLDPQRVFVIPNAITTDNGHRIKVGTLDKILQDQAYCNDRDRTIVVVMVNRLYYRKGLDLAVQVIPVICSRFSNIKFVIAGDGPKMDDLLAMREFHRLEKRVILLGTVPHDKIKDVLKQGHIFLNCSIAEVFCISILEAAYFGLLVVTTNVGGIIEVLPDSNPQVVRYTEANVYSIIKVLSKAIKEVNYINQSDLEKLRHKLQIVYNWHSVAERTEQVYNVLKPPPGKLQILMRFLKMRTCAGFIYFLILLGNVFYLYILDKLCT